MKSDDEDGRRRVGVRKFGGILAHAFIHTAAIVSRSAEIGRRNIHTRHVQGGNHRTARVRLLHTAAERGT